MNHFIKLPNGRYLVLAYDKDGLFIGSSFDGKSVYAWICIIDGAYTAVLPNSSDAGSAFEDLEQFKTIAPMVTHSSDG